MGFFDRIGAALSPAARPQASTETQGSRWRGASQTLRSLVNWSAGIGSPTSDLPDHERRTLRARSRDAFRSHLLARAALTRSRTNIVGTGLMCRPSIDFAVLGIDADEAERINGVLRSHWEMWAEDPVQCDMEATLDIYGLQSLALLSAMSSGDVFALTPREARPGGTSELKVQLIEADRVCNPMEAANSDTLIDGVRLGTGGLPLGYYVLNTHPGDTINVATLPRWQFYPTIGAETGRRVVLHVWNDKERPGQVRGAPYLAPILEPLKQLERFGDAELMAAVVSAMLTVFITRGDDGTDQNGDPVHAIAGTQQAPGAAAPTMNLGRGAIIDLAPGEKPIEVNPARPSAKFEPFFLAIVKQIGAALELPLDELLLHYQSSYSAARAAMLQAWRFYSLRRWQLAQQFCVPIYGLFVDEQVASGRLSLPGYSDPVRRRAWTRAMWIGPARGAMDEHKEALAARTRIEIGVSNEAMETAAMSGEDWDSVYAQRVREINRRKADGTFVEQSNVSQQIRTTEEPTPNEPERPSPADKADEDAR